MDREYELNIKRLRKLKEEQKKAQSKSPKEPKPSRAAQLAEGYQFSIPKFQAKQKGFLAWFLSKYNN